MNQQFFKTYGCLLLVLLVSGCASTTTQKHSGFLGNYDNLVDSKQYKLTKVYNLGDFSKVDIVNLTDIKLEPFELWINNTSSRHFNPQQLAELSSYFTRTLAHQLNSKGYNLVDTATANTLTIRGAFSDIQFSKPELSPTDFIPFRIVLNAGNAAYLNITDKKDVITTVSIEVEFLKGTQQQRVFAMIASKHLDATVANNGSDNLAAVLKVLDKWVNNFVTKISTIRDAG